MDLVEFFFGKLLRLEPKSDHEAQQQGNRLRLAKAASISRLVLAVKISICRPVATADACAFDVDLSDWTVGIDKYGKTPGLGQQLIQEPEALGLNLRIHGGDTSDVAPRPVKASDENLGCPCSFAAQHRDQCQDTASRFLGQCQHTDWIGLCWAMLALPTGTDGVSSQWQRVEATPL